MINNNKGMTAIEVLISLLLITIVMAASFQFYEVYESKITKFGESNTAKNLAISTNETQIELTNLGLSNTGNVFNGTTNIKGVPYRVTVTKTLETSLVAHYSSVVPFYKITTKVAWKNKDIVKDIEVISYVSKK